MKEMTSLLSIITFSQQIIEKVPEGSTSVPRISTYQLNKHFDFSSKLFLNFLFIYEVIFFLSISIICVMSLISNVFVLSLHYRSYQIQGPLPKWVNTFIFI